MAEYIYIPEQIVVPGNNILLEDSIPCNRGYVMHRNGSGILTLRGIVNCPTSGFARYQIAYNGNIALAEGATVGEISVALAIAGESLNSSLAAATPTAVESFFNVTSTAIITVPRGCCFTIAVENTSSAATAGGVAPSIIARNSNLVITRIA